MAYSAAKRGTHVEPRTSDFVRKKMDAGLAVIAINPETKEWTGFCYLEVWQHKKFVANSGLIVSPEYRGMGISTGIKTALFKLCREKFPCAKILSLTTSPAVMHVNTELGYKIVPYSTVLKDKLFLKGCNSWVNFTGLMNDNHSTSHYIAMLYDPLSNAEKPASLPAGEYLLNKVKSTWRKKEAQIAVEHAVV